ncbi:MAG: F0F1 ATP synthase subunit gamma [Gammaproteobacteria bacterium]|nr:F0F1 ATP synthase subunit gamma [Gammaproteobacteria bacterium]MCH9745024.1 F0F1 ATP synthase subunit gamma [Gammaproteobacteria bacterium]
MAQTREIRGKIASVKSTQKITRAMELVAASKMRRAQDQMARSKPYSIKIRKVISHLAAATSEFNHPYLQKREQIKRVGYIVVTTDRGLCGGLNVNLFRALMKDMKQWSDKGVEIDLCLIGRKGGVFFKRFGGTVVGAAEHLGDAPAVQDIVGVIQIMLKKFDEGEIDSVYVASNEFINTMVQKPSIQQLLPLEPDKKEESQGHWDYIYEPDDARKLLTMLLVRYVESQVYQAVVENIACEQGARMVAMKSATDNAGDIIKDLQLMYNKARQASITQEISEICGGAAAIE